MKRAIFFFIVFIICVSAAAQDISSDFKTESKAALLEGTKGVLYKRITYRTNQLLFLTSTLNITPVMLIDLNTDIKEPFIRLTTLSSGKEYSSYIDYDEIPSCLKVIDYILNYHEISNPFQTISYITKTKDGILIEASYENNGLSKGSLSITHTKYVTNPFIMVAVKQLLPLRNGLETAKKTLDQALSEL